MKDPLLSKLRKELSQQLRQEAPAEPAPAARKAPPPPEPEVDDATLFAAATRGARRLHVDVPPPTTSSPSKRPRPDANARLRRLAAEAEEAPDTPLSDAAALIHDTTPESALSWARNGVQPRQLQRLQQAKLPWQAAVDLHGCTVDQAREAVLGLLRDARAADLHVVKVVHGKSHARGEALLKTFVNGWLRQLPEVLAFVSAQPRDGGTGAVYVLLKRRRPDTE
ncbi:MAG: Smr/MutS family protein [Moraxellaceae bacterium]|nr:Smr/MutS family protein [Moraxellaceae bacterium]